MQKTYPNDRTATGKTDRSEALDRLARQNPGGSIEIRPTDRERFHQAYVELGIVAFLTVIHVANRVQGVNNGGSLRGFSRDALLLRLLALFWAVALANLWTALRFTVRLDEQGVSVFNGFWRKTVRWDEAFLAEWRTKTISDGEGGSHTAWRLEIRDATVPFPCCRVMGLATPLGAWKSVMRRARSKCASPRKTWNRTGP